MRHWRAPSRRLFPARCSHAPPVPCRPHPGGVVAGAAVAPASADSYNDTTTGIYVATPDDFRISRGVREGYALALHINPTGSYPNRVEGESRLCGLYFKAVPSAETQQWLNARWKHEALLAEVRRLFERIIEVKSEETFTLRDEKAGDVVGLEVVGPVAPGSVGRFDDVPVQHPARSIADELPAAVGSGREGGVCPARHPGHDQAAEVNRRRRPSEETSPCAALFP